MRIAGEVSRQKIAEGRHTREHGTGSTEKSKREPQSKGDLGRANQEERLAAKRQGNQEAIPSDRTPKNRLQREKGLGCLKKIT